MEKKKHNKNLTRAFSGEASAPPTRCIVFLTDSCRHRAPYPRTCNISRIIVNKINHSAAFRINVPQRGFSEESGSTVFSNNDSAAFLEEEHRYIFHCVPDLFSSTAYCNGRMTMVCKNHEYTTRIGEIVKLTCRFRVHPHFDSACGRANARIKMKSTHKNGRFNTVSLPVI